MATEKRKLPVKTAQFDLNGDYEGWNFTARVNPPIGVLRLIVSGEIDKIVSALSQTILDWNFVDERGRALGKPSEETIDLLPVDMLTQMAQMLADGIGNVPKN